MNAEMRIFGWAAALVWLIVTASLLLRRQTAEERRQFAVRLETPWVRVTALMGMWLAAALAAALIAWALPERVPEGAAWATAAMTVLVALARLRAARPTGVIAFLALIGGFSTFGTEVVPPPSVLFASSPDVLARLSPGLGALAQTIEEAQRVLGLPAVTWLSFFALAAFAEGVAVAALAAPLFRPYAVRSARGGVETGTSAVHVWWAPLVVLAAGPGAPSFTVNAAPSPLIGLIAVSRPNLSSRAVRRAEMLSRFGAAGLAGLLAWAAASVPDSTVDRLLVPLLLWMLDRLMRAERSPRDRRTRKKTSLPSGVGVPVLATAPASPARRLGIAPGWRLVEVNRHPVASITDVYRALRDQPAYVRLVLLDARGERVFREAPRYDGGHHLFGLIFPPEQASSPRPLGGWLSLWRRGGVTPRASRRKGVSA